MCVCVCVCARARARAFSRTVEVNETGGRGAREVTGVGRGGGVGGRLSLSLAELITPWRPIGLRRS